MKKLILLIILMSITSIAVAAGPAAKNRLSWSLLYGYSKNDNDLDYAPAGPAYKFMFGGRTGIFDMHVFLRYMDGEGDIKYQTTEASITHNNLTAGGQVGIWALPFLNLHVGYARHSIGEKLNGSFPSSAQRDAAEKLYQLDDRKTGGLFYGGDLVLLQTTNIQLFANYDNYRLNGLSANEWEVLGGLRFYYDASGSSGGGGQGNWFTKMFQNLFNPSK